MTKKASTTRAHQQALLKLSPFELKDELIKLAKVAERDDVAQFLDAGRGNPNWICTTPRDAFGTLLRFGLEESRRGVNIPDVGRQIARTPGLAERFETFLKANPKAPGIKLLRDTWDYGDQEAEVRSRRLRLRTGPGHHRRPVSRARPDAPLLRTHRA